MTAPFARNALEFALESSPGVRIYVRKGPTLSGFPKEVATFQIPGSPGTFISLDIGHGLERPTPIKMDNEYLQVGGLQFSKLVTTCWIPWSEIAVVAIDSMSVSFTEALQRPDAPGLRVVPS